MPHERFVRQRGQGVGSFVNDFATFTLTGGSAFTLTRAVMYPSVPTIYSYSIVLVGTPYTAASDGMNWQNSMERE
jgi:hypothetical protein